MRPLSPLISALQNAYLGSCLQVQLKQDHCSMHHSNLQGLHGDCCSADQPSTQRQCRMMTMTHIMKQLQQLLDKALVYTVLRINLHAQLVQPAWPPDIPALPHTRRR